MHNLQINLAQQIHSPLSSRIRNGPIGTLELNERIGRAIPRRTNLVVDDTGFGAIQRALYLIARKIDGSGFIKKFQPEGGSDEISELTCDMENTPSCWLVSMDLSDKLAGRGSPHLDQSESSTHVAEDRSVSVDLDVPELNIVTSSASPVNRGARSVSWRKFKCE